MNYPTLENEVRAFAGKLVAKLRADHSLWIKVKPGVSKSAVTCDNIPVSARSEAACKWCLEGFLEKEFMDNTISAIFKFRELSIGEDKSLHIWNDRPETTVEDIIDLLEKVAAGNSYDTAS